MAPPKINLRDARKVKIPKNKNYVVGSLVGSDSTELIELDSLALKLSGRNGLLTPSITAQLDKISSVQGSILYRDSAAWAALAPDTTGKVLTTHGAAANPTWETPSSGGYNPGTPPTVVQTAFSVGGGNSAVFGVAPTSGNYMLAMCFNPTSSTVGAGWTKEAENSSGTDFGVILSKVAGGAESTTQTPLSGVGGTGGIVIWELNGQNATSPLVFAASQPEQGGSYTLPVAVTNAEDCIGLSAVGVVTVSILAGYSVGTQDVLDNSGSRKLLAGHTDLGQTPLAGLFAALASSNNSKAATALVRA